MVMINGAVEGIVYATRHLELAPSARVIGDVYYSIIEMAAGAEINGRLLHRLEQEAPGEQVRIAELQLRVASSPRTLAKAPPAQPPAATAPPAQPPAAKVD
jgi:cytoskeletal protein CcmA (bactofilin family)